MQAIPNQQAQTIANSWEKLTQRMTMNGQKYNNFILENEISSELKNAFEKYDITYEYVLQKYTEEMQQRE